MKLKAAVVFVSLALVATLAARARGQIPYGFHFAFGIGCT